MITTQGANLLAGENITLTAKRDIVLQAAANTSEIHNSNKSSSVGGGVTFAFGGQQNGLSFQLNASQGKGKANGSKTVWDNTLITAAESLSVKSGRDTTLQGAQLAGKSVTLDAGRDLLIETLQERSTYASQQSSSGFSLSLCIPPLCGGATVTGSLSASEQKIKHSYLSALGQSGIAAGEGGFDIRVGQHTELVGAAITGSDDASRNRLSTASLASRDLENAQNTKSSSSSLSAGYSGASALTTLAGNAASNLLGNLQGNAALPKNGSEHSQTQSVISPASVTITGSGNTETDDASRQTVATLTSRDPATANGSLKNTLTLQQAQGLQGEIRKQQENMEAAKLVGAVVSNAIGDLAQKQGWQEGGPEKLALHGLAGLIQAKVGGGSAAAGVLAGMAHEALVPAMTEFLNSQGFDESTPEKKVEFNALMNAGSTLLGAAVGAVASGTVQGAASGASVALMADVNNRQLHPSEAQLIKDNAARYAARKGIGIEQAVAELTQQAERQNDSAWATRLGSDNKDAQAFLKELGQGKTLVDSMTGQTFQLFTADAATRDNHAMFAQYTKTDPLVRAELDLAMNQAFKPKDAQTLDHRNMSGSDMALNDAARDFGNMKNQPATVQWAVLGELRQTRQQNQQAVAQLEQERAGLTLSSENTQRRGELQAQIDTLAQRDQTLLGSIKSQLLDMGSAGSGLLIPGKYREWTEGFGEARAMAGLNFKDVGQARIGARADMIKGAIQEVKAVAEAEKAAQRAVDGARIENAYYRDANLVPEPRSLTNIQTRDWYKARMEYIDAVETQMLSNGASSKDIFEATTLLRNKVKIQAREFMADQELAKSLPPPKKPEDILGRYNGNYEEAIAASKRTNEPVNKEIERRRLAGEH